MSRFKTHFIPLNWPQPQPQQQPHSGVTEPRLSDVLSGAQSDLDEKIEAARAVVTALEAIGAADQAWGGVPAKKRKWAQDFLLARDMPGFSLIWDELYENNPERFFVSFRMSPQVFDILLSEIEAAIYHQVMFLKLRKLLK